MSVPTRNNYLYFTKKERRGTLILMLIISLLCALPFVIPFFIRDELVEKESIEQPMQALQAKQNSVKSKSSYNKYDNENYRPYDEPSYAGGERYNSTTGTLFYFDPNTLNEAGWKKLGLKDKTIATIVNYRNKGGKFRQADDIKKIWGLQASLAERLIPYVQISISENDQNQRNYSNQFTSKPISERKYSIIDINAADTSLLISLPGIGSKLSQRIIHFRNNLGGFYKVEQVAETFALPDSTYQRIRPLLQINTAVKTININTADVNQLKQHPYIKYPLANAIIQYRQQHGNFGSVNDIKKIMIVDDVVYNKLVPYLSVQ